MEHATTLGTDAHTAFRLVMDDDGRAPVGRVLAAWNTLGRHASKRTLEDLPDDMTRDGGHLTSSLALEPIRLGFDDALAEAFRLSALHRAPDADGWHFVSNVARVFVILAGGRSPREMGAGAGRITQAMRTHPMLEIRDRLPNEMEVRVRGDVISTTPVATRVTCPGDDAPRALEDASSFGGAFRRLQSIDATLIAHGTLAEFTRGDELRVAAWSAQERAWMTPDATPLRRTDPTDPARHHYRNGHMVDTLVGFVSRSHTGRIFANVGIPIDSEGDDDAFVPVRERQEAATVEEAAALLAERTDLDHVLPGVERYDGQMGFWLRAMGRDAR